MRPVFPAVAFYLGYYLAVKLPYNVFYNRFLHPGSKKIVHHQLPHEDDLVARFRLYDETEVPDERDLFATYLSKNA